MTWSTDSLLRGAGTCPHCGNSGTSLHSIGINPNRKEPTWARCWKCMALWNFLTGGFVAPGGDLPPGLLP